MAFNGSRDRRSSSGGRTEVTSASSGRRRRPHYRRSAIQHRAVVQDCEKLAARPKLVVLV